MPKQLSGGKKNNTMKNLHKKDEAQFLTGFITKPYHEEKVVVDLPTIALEDAEFAAFLNSRQIEAEVVGRLRGAPYSDIVQYTGSKAAIVEMAGTYWEMPSEDVMMLSFFTFKK